MRHALELGHSPGLLAPPSVGRPHPLLRQKGAAAAVQGREGKSWVAVAAVDVTDTSCCDTR